MSKQIISYCGDLCNECPRYTATKSNSRKELEYLAELWYRLGFRDSIMDPEDMKCSGCSKEKECTEGINKCKHLENINNCGECQHFPCDNINRVFEKAEYYKEKCKGKCSEMEYQIINRAFFLKKNLLKEINSGIK